MKLKSFLSYKVPSLSNQIQFLFLFSGFFCLGLNQGFAVSHDDLQPLKSFENLAPKVQNDIQNGELVLEFLPVNGKVWPQAMGYMRVNATPEESAAVLFDFKLQAGHFHRVSKSDVIRTVPLLPPNQVLVDYELGLSFLLKPFFPDTRYRVLNELACNSKSSSLKWQLVSSKFFTDFRGYAVFESLGTGSMIGYTNYLESSSHLMNLPLVSNGIKRGNFKALKSIRDRIEYLKTNDPTTLSAEVKSFRDALEESGQSSCWY